MTTTEAQKPASADERLAYRGPLRRLFTRPDIGALVGAGALWMFFWWVSDVFGTVPGAQTYLDVSASLGIMAVAVALLMIGGEFDLSSGAMTGATAMLVVLLARPAGDIGGLGMSLFLAVPLSFLFAFGIGWLNGTMVEKTGLPSFIVTLGTFFVLIGAKLGFAKLFTGKVIVEGLDRASGYEFWSDIFSADWTRSDHIFETRDAWFGTFLIVGVVALLIGVFELSFTRRERFNSGGLPLFLGGIALAVFGLVRLLGTDRVVDNWIYGALVGAGVIIGALGLGAWRYQPVEGTQSRSFGAGSSRAIAYGFAALAVAVVASLILDKQSEKVYGFLLTEQGLRAILMTSGITFGIGALLASSFRAAKESRSGAFLLRLISVAGLVGFAFLIQSLSDSRKFRVEMFGVLLLSALVLLIVSLLQLRYEARHRPMPAADRTGRILTGVGIGLIVLAGLTRTLFTTTSELAATPGQIVFRSSILWFIAFAVVASWMLTNTRFGSWTFAVGGNNLAARSVGVPAARTKRRLFIMVSLSAWLVGMLIAFRLNSVQANVGDGLEFRYIIAAVVGGNLLTGGYGSAAGAAVGAMIMAMSTQGTTFAQWNTDWATLFLGVILLLAVLANRYVRSRAEAMR